MSFPNSKFKAPNVFISVVDDTGSAVIRGALSAPVVITNNPIQPVISGIFTSNTPTNVPLVLDQVANPLPTNVFYSNTPTNVPLVLGDLGNVFYSNTPTNVPLVLG